MFYRFGLRSERQAPAGCRLATPLCALTMGEWVPAGNKDFAFTVMVPVHCVVIATVA